MLADTCSVIVQEMLIFCLSCVVSFLFSLSRTSTLQCLWSHCPFDMKNVLIVLWLIISRRGEKFLNMAWWIPSASAKAFAHFRISLQWQLFSNLLLLNIAFCSSTAGLIFVCLLRELTLSHSTFLKIISFSCEILWNWIVFVSFTKLLSPLLSLLRSALSLSITKVNNPTAVDCLIQELR